MAEERVQRRLVAILAADVVGYSRLMEVDEAGTLAALKARRKEVLDPVVARHQGRIFKVTGDGVLVEFSSAVDAVQCGVELQHGMAAANGGLLETHRIVLRIGVNLGDVMVEGSDLYGDGVNIASRLEGMAEPGGVLISGTVYDQVKNKIKSGFEELGTRNLKNIAEPMRIYRIAGTASAAQFLVGDLPLPSKPSIAVLPFTNLSGDPEQQYFSDGITEDIITELSRFHSLFVVARNSSFAFRDKSVDVNEIGRKLGVQHVLEGSVRKASNRVRITAQLVEAETRNHVWAERYDRDLRDVFAIQEELAHEIVGTVAGRLESARSERAKRKPTNSLEAYECLLRGLDAARTAYFDSEVYLRDGLDFSRHMLERAAALDPNYAVAHASLAFACLVEFNYLGAPELLSRAVEHGRSAVGIDPHDHRTHLMLGWAYLYSRRYEQAKSHIERAVEINPNDSQAAHVMGEYLHLVGRPRDAIEWVEKAHRLNPFDRDWYLEAKAIVLYSAREYEAAAAAFGKFDRAPAWIAGFLAATYAQLGRLAEARTEMEKFKSFSNHLLARANSESARYPGVPRALIAYLDLYKSEEDRDHWLDGFRKAGLPV